MFAAAMAEFVNAAEESTHAAINNKFKTRDIGRRGCLQRAEQASENTSDVTALHAQISAIQKQFTAS